ncbi:hypothetical protein FOPE_07010 [Fonsecaea pedrosoi]|nr:hypothetical protein FOPE_07010 [Fonsecaea pedrosoi]
MQSSDLLGPPLRQPQITLSSADEPSRTLHQSPSRTIRSEQDSQDLQRRPARIPSSSTTLRYFRETRPVPEKSRKPNLAGGPQPKDKGDRQKKERPNPQEAQSKDKTSSSKETNVPPRKPFEYSQLLPEIRVKVNADAQRFYRPPGLRNLRILAEWLQEGKLRYGQALQRGMVAKQHDAHLHRQKAQREKSGHPLSALENAVFEEKVGQCRRAIRESESFLMKFQNQQNEFKVACRQRATVRATTTETRFRKRPSSSTMNYIPDLPTLRVSYTISDDFTGGDDVFKTKRLCLLMSDRYLFEWQNTVATTKRPRLV